MSDDKRGLIFLDSVFHSKIWGGRRLETDFGYELPDGPVGECWAISAHPHGDCRIRGGVWDGMHLSELWAHHRELFGNLAGGVFPLLVKILDAEDDLSIQVHPDDAYAAEHEAGSLGKRECWYVLDAHEGAHIVVGQHAHDRDEFSRLASAGRWDDLLNEVPIAPGDFFMVEPGTVHAILAGTLVLETQQSSDVTYRVYDFDRVQPDGTLRPLHLERALDVIDYDAAPPTSGVVTSMEMGGVTHLVTSASFAVDRVRVTPDAPVCLSQPWPFLCVSVVAGSGTAEVEGASHEIPAGTHFIAPAGCGGLNLAGNMTLVVSHV